MLHFTEFDDWTGSIDDLCQKAQKWLHLLGRDDGADLNVRLIRDYAQRGILSPSTDRRGKEVLYSTQHLRELVAARFLRKDGWSLTKIGEEFNKNRRIVFATLGLDTPERLETASPERYLNTAQKYLAMNAPSGELKSSRPDHKFGSSAAFAFSSLSGSRRRMELTRSFDALGVKASAVETDEVLRLKLTDWCSVLLDIRKARELDAEEAEALGSALTAALLDRVVVIKKL